MAKAYSLDLRERVLAAAAEGMPLAEAAARFGVSVPSIVRWRALEREGRGVGPKPFGGGRRSARIEAARETVFALLRGNPGLSIRALLAALAERGHVLGYGALYGFLTRHGFKGKQAGRGRNRADESETAALRAVADDLRERVLAAVEAGMPNAEAGRLFRVNPATIARWRRQPRQPGGG